MNTKKWYRKEYLTSEHWILMRHRVYNRWGYKCSVLGCSKTKIDIHHISYEHIGTDAEYYDLRPLCRLHHLLCHYQILRFRKVPMNRANLTKRYYQVKRMNWKFIRPSDLFSI